MYPNYGSDASASWPSYRSNSLTSDGFFAIMASNTWAGPVGCLRPCSQLSNVPLATPMLRANALCDRPVRARIAAVGKLVGCK